jgi:hypothetical protein
MGERIAVAEFPQNPKEKTEKDDSVDGKNKASKERNYFEVQSEGAVFC